MRNNYKRLFLMSLYFLIFTPLLILIINKAYIFFYGIPMVQPSAGKSNGVVYANLSQAFRLENGRLYINWEEVERLPPALNVSYPYGKNVVFYYPGVFVKFDQPKKETINRDGIRATKNYSVAKPANVYRIVLLGDSFVYGCGVEDNETLSFLLEHLLNQESKGKLYEVLNFGAGGYNTAMEVERFEKVALKYKPNMVILFYNANDIERGDITAKLDRSLMRYLSSHIKDQVVAWNLRLKVIPEYNRRYLNGSFDGLWMRVSGPLKRLDELSKKWNFSVIVVAYPSPVEHIRKLRETAKSYGWEFIDLEGKIGYKFQDPWIIDTKDTHPSPYANKKVTELLAYGYILQ